MSYTGVYGPLHYDGDPDTVDNPERAPLITDRERWDELCESHEWKHIFGDQAVLEDHETDTYPRKVWDKLVGFRSFDKDVFDDLNIDRIAYNYSRDSFHTFWKLVGECTEPFWFAHSGEDNHWPTTNWYDFDDPEPEYEEAVYRVCVNGGDIAVARGFVEFTGFGSGDVGRSDGGEP